MLIVETLAADSQAATAQESPPSQSSPEPDDGEGSVRLSARRQASSQYADSVQSLLAARLGSNADAGPGPGSPPQLGTQQASKSVHRRNDTASSRLPSPDVPVGYPAQASGGGPPEGPQGQARAELTTRRSLSFSDALPEGQDLNQAGQQPSAVKASEEPMQSGRPSPRLGRTSTGKSGHDDVAR